MSGSETKRTTGGCLCRALRYEAVGEPLGAGHCYCVDCRRASGSGFIPFMGFKADFGPLHRRSARVPVEGGERRRRGAQSLRGVHEPRVRRRDRQVRLVHALCGLARRPLSLPSDDRHLRPRPPAVGAHPARLQGVRPPAGLTAAPGLGGLRLSAIVRRPQDAQTAVIVSWDCVAAPASRQESRGPLEASGPRERRGRLRVTPACQFPVGSGMSIPSFSSFSRTHWKRW